MDSLEYRDAIAEQVAYLRSAMPADIAAAIRLANSDLYNGPVYLDSDGDAASCFDEGATQFDFCGACDRIREWLDSHCDDLQEESSFDDETGESTYERIDGSARDITRELVGRELFPHVI
jgi:hypothetical protein